MVERITDWFVKASLVWDILAVAASRRELLTYKVVGDQVGLHHRVMSYPLGTIQSYCVTENIPILAAIVIGKGSGVPGGGSVAAGRDDIDEMQEDVFKFDWFAHGNPFKEFEAGQTLDGFTAEIVENPDVSEDVYSRVKVRGIAQQVFRNAVAKAYGWRCAMCDLSFWNILEAAHIVRWTKATPAQRLSPCNGLLLCPTHHRLFDKACITVTDDYHIRYYDPQAEDGEYSLSDLQVSSDLHGKKLHLPESEKHWPNVDWIKERNSDDGWDDEPVVTSDSR